MTNYIYLYLFFVYIIYLCSNNSDNENYTDILVTDGYWFDRDRDCSQTNPCYMTCIEFNRFIIKCDKDNMNCIKGSYDWCTGELDF